MRGLLLDLDSYGGTDPLGMFHLFLKRATDVLAPRLDVVFRQLLRFVSFPVCWRWLCHPNFEGSTFLLSGQLQTNFL